jgi:hypothetical protein
MNKESINTEIANMNVGDSILVSFKGTSTSKIQITLGEKIVTKSGNPLALLNASDAKFNVTSKARRAWLTSEPSDAKIYFPQYASQIDEAAAGDKSTEVFIGELNPSIAGQVLRVELKETTTPTAYQANNVESTARVNPSTGELQLFEGKPIFSNTRVIFGTPDHDTLEADPISVAQVSTMVAEDMVA